MRPGSRGGYGAAGGGGMGGMGMTGGGPGMRPMSRTGLGSSAGGRPGSRLGTGRLGTGVAEPVFAGVGMNTDVSISARPVTTQGMVGMRIKTAGPGRQIRDVTYFLGLLRGKSTELQTEITKLKGDIEKYHKDSSTYQTLERKYEGLIKEVRNLEGQLADYNLAMDKSRTSTHPNELQQYHMQLKRRNEHEAKLIDEVFVQHREKEQQTHGLEEQLKRLREEAEARMNSLPPRELEEYKSLSAENTRMGSELAQLQGTLEALNEKVGMFENEVKRNRWRDEAVRLEHQIERLRREKVGLDEAMRETSLDPDVARAKLLAKVKDDNAAIQRLNETLARIKEANVSKARTLADLEADIEERNGEGGESHKYEVLYQRDQEMSDFIEKFPEAKAAAEEEQKSAEVNIVGLLKHISRGIERQTDMPSKEVVDEMASELGGKAAGLANSETTHERLKAELELRKADLVKIETLDSKISVELTSLNEKIASMNAEMVKFEDIAGLRKSHEAAKALLIAKRDEYTKRRDMIKPQVMQLSGLLDRKKSKLAENPTARSLEDLEGTLRMHEQAVFSLREYIVTKGKATEYESMRDSCVKVTDELNAHIIKAQGTFTSPIMGAPY